MALSPCAKLVAASSFPEIGCSGVLSLSRSHTAKSTNRANKRPTYKRILQFKINGWRWLCTSLLSQQQFAIVTPQRLCCPQQQFAMVTPQRLCCSQQQLKGVTPHRLWHEADDVLELFWLHTRLQLAPRTGRLRTRAVLCHWCWRCKHGCSWRHASRNVLCH